MALEKVTISRRDNRVVLSYKGMAAGLTWTTALDLYMAMKVRHAQAKRYEETGEEPFDLGPERIGNGKLVVRRIGLMLLLELNDRIWIEIPHEPGFQIAAAICAKAHEIESDLMKIAEMQIKDQALLLRLGVPVGLLNDARKIYEAKKLAAGVKGLPHGNGVVGAPTVRRYPPQNSKRGD